MSNLISLHAHTILCSGNGQLPIMRDVQVCARQVMNVRAFMRAAFWCSNTRCVYERIHKGSFKEGQFLRFILGI